MVEGTELVLGAGEQDDLAKVTGQEEKRLQVCRLPQIPVPPPGPHLEDQRGRHPPVTAPHRPIPQGACVSSNSCGKPTRWGERGPHCHLPTEQAEIPAGETTRPSLQSWGQQALRPHPDALCPPTRCTGTLKRPVRGAPQEASFRCEPG